MRLPRKISQLIMLISLATNATDEERNFFKVRNWMRANDCDLENNSSLNVVGELFDIFDCLNSSNLVKNSSQSIIWTEQLTGASLTSLRKYFSEKNLVGAGKLLADFWNSEDSYLGAVYTHPVVGLRSKLAELLILWRMYCTVRSRADISLADMGYLSKVGNPSGLRYKNSLINALSIRHSYDAWQISRISNDGDVILEIGGGHGSLAGKALQKKRLKYIDVDLIETLYSAYYFLRVSCPDLKIFFCTSPEDVADIKNILQKHDLVLVPSIFKDSLHNFDVNVIFNSYSFSEMRQVDIDGYMELIHRLAPKFLLHENFTGDENLEDGILKGLVSARNFRPVGYREVCLTKSVDFRNTDCRRFLFVKLD